jgi:succinate dehydrogenase/fumarate reductase flavoprotein subunit
MWERLTMVVRAPASVVVVGAGMSGLAAALTAQEEGAAVTLLEAGAAPGGSAALSAGFITTFGSYEDYQRRIPLGEQAQGRLVAEQYDGAIRWLTNLGIVFEADNSGQAEGEFGFTRRHRMTPPVAMAHLARVFTDRGGVLRTGTRAVRLLADEQGAVTGVLAQSAAARETHAAKAVVLASGGFQGNPELTTRYLGRWADRMLVRSNPHSVGDGLLMGLALGAGTSRALHSFYGHLMPAPPAVLPPERFFPPTAYYSRATVLVNLAGERFADESLGDHMNAQAAVRQERAAVFAIFDQDVHDQYIVGRPSGHPEGLNRLEAAREAGAWFATAPTLDKLGGLLAERGVRRNTLSQTLHAYNRAMAEGTDEPLPVPRAELRAPLWRAPFYAIALAPAITLTYGGLRVDGRCRVLDRAGYPIAGLYAAGADAGGTYFEQYGGGLAMALTLGRVAGAEAARAAGG